MFHNDYPANRGETDVSCESEYGVSTVVRGLYIVTCDFT